MSRASQVADRNLVATSKGTWSRGRVLDAVDRARPEPERERGGGRSGDEPLPGLSSPQASVARVLVSAASEDGWCWLCRVKIALRAKLSDETVRKVLVQLKRKNWLDEREQPASRGGSVRAYRVTPVAADLMSEDEIDAAVAAAREAWRARKADWRQSARGSARGPGAGAPPSMGVAVPHDGGLERRPDVPGSDADLSRQGVPDVPACDAGLSRQRKPRVLASEADLSRQGAPDVPASPAAGSLHGTSTEDLPLRACHDWVGESSGMRRDAANGERFQRSHDADASLDPTTKRSACVPVAPRHVELDPEERVRHGQFAPPAQAPLAAGERFVTLDREGSDEPPCVARSDDELLAVLKVAAEGGNRWAISVLRRLPEKDGKLTPRQRRTAVEIAAELAAGAVRMWPRAHPSRYRVTGRQEPAKAGERGWTSGEEVDF